MTLNYSRRIALSQIFCVLWGFSGEYAKNPNDEIRKQLPLLYSNEEKGLSAIAPVKYFHPQSNWTWYASEGAPIDEDGFIDTDKEKTDFLFFGLVDGLELELGYFTLSQLQSIGQDDRTLPVERDLSYEPQSLAELQQLHRKLRGEGGV